MSPSISYRIQSLNFYFEMHIRVLMARRADNCLQYSRIRPELDYFFLPFDGSGRYRGILILSELFMRPNVCSTGSLALVLLDRCAALYHHHK